MAQLNDLLKNPTVRNTAIGIGVAVLVPVVAKALAPLVRPAARSAVKIGVVAYEKGREAFAEFGEIVDDMIAEVREEMRAEQETNDAAPGEILADTDDASDLPAETRKDSGAS
jgi:hypothetical protein